MKKLLSITGLVIFLIAIMPLSCKKDKDKSIQEQLTGWWDATKVRMVEYTNGVQTSDETMTLPSGTFAFELKNDGTAYMYTECEADEPADWEMDGNDLIIDGDAIDYTLSGNTLVFTMVEEYDIYRDELTFTCNKGDGSTCD
ncbi:MAG: hypothetical protein NTZ85_11715 [Bacteroidia bacterium]|nr:hypothetical protein [Bacteroidia bacterium]